MVARTPFPLAQPFYHKTSLGSITYLMRETLCIMSIASQGIEGQ